MTSTKMHFLHRKLKSASCVILAAAMFLTLTGCQTTEQTTEPPLQAAAAYDCDVMQGFSNPSSSVDTDAIKSRISDIEKQINDLEQNIASRQNELTALLNTEKSEELQRLEQEIAALQEQISSLQSELEKLQLEFQTLRSAQKSDAMTTLENEIRNLQAQVSTLKNTLNDLQREMNESSHTEQSRVGYIEYIKIGDTELVGDITVTDPVSSTQSSVVGVVSSIFWDGGYAEPISFSCQVSDMNKSRLQVLTHSTLSNTAVEFAFSVYEYDFNAKKYYKCFHTNSARLNGMIYKSGGQLAIGIDSEPRADVTNPKNFTFDLGVMPQSADQDIHLAFSVTDRLVKKWGVEVSG